jgi:hypothetical protein
MTFDVFNLCRERDSNPHALCKTQDFKSCASTNSAIPASNCKLMISYCGFLKIPRLTEAPSGFEPLHKGFADLSLTTWVRRQINFQLSIFKVQFGSSNFDNIQNTKSPQNKNPAVRWGKWQRGKFIDKISPDVSKKP